MSMWHKHGYKVALCRHIEQDKHECDGHERESRYITGEFAQV